MPNPLTSKISVWKSINPPDRVYDWISDGVKFPFLCEVPNFEHVQPTFYGKLLKGQIEFCESKPKCVSPIRCVPKKNKSFRLICDLRHPNFFTNPPAFQHEDIYTVKNLVKPRDFIVTIDLKQGFHDY